MDSAGVWDACVHPHDVCCEDEVCQTRDGTRRFEWQSVGVRSMSFERILDPDCDGGKRAKDLLHKTEGKHLALEFVGCNPDTEGAELRVLDIDTQHVYNVPERYRHLYPDDQLAFYIPKSWHPIEDAQRHQLELSFVLR